MVGRTPDRETVVIDDETGRPLHESVLPAVVRGIDGEDPLVSDDPTPAIVRKPAVRRAVISPVGDDWVDKLADAIFPDG